MSHDSSKSQQFVGVCEMNAYQEARFCKTVPNGGDFFRLFRCSFLILSDFTHQFWSGVSSRHTGTALGQWASNPLPLRDVLKIKAPVPSVHDS